MEVKNYTTIYTKNRCYSKSYVDITISENDSKVCMEIAKGWEPIGGISVSFFEDNNDDFVIVSQAMILKKKEETL